MFIIQLSESAISLRVAEKTWLMMMMMMVMISIINLSNMPVKAMSHVLTHLKGIKKEYLAYTLENGPNYFYFKSTGIT